MTCVKLIGKKKKEQVCEFFKNLTSSLSKRDIELAELQATITALQTTVATLETKFNKRFLAHLLSNLEEFIRTYCMTVLGPLAGSQKEFSESTSEQTEYYIKLGLVTKDAKIVVGAKKLKKSLSNLIQDGKLVSDVPSLFNNLDDEELYSWLDH